MIACHSEWPNGWRQFLTIKIWTRHNLTFPHRRRRQNGWLDGPDAGREKRHLSSFLRRNFLLISHDVWLVAFCSFLLISQAKRKEVDERVSINMSNDIFPQSTNFFLQRLSLPHRCRLPPGFAIISSRLDDWNVCNSLFRSANMANNIFLPCWICCATRKKMCLHLQKKKTTTFSCKSNSQQTWDVF